MQQNEPATLQLNFLLFVENKSIKRLVGKLAGSCSVVWFVRSD